MGRRIKSKGLVAALIRSNRRELRKRRLALSAQARDVKGKAARHREAAIRAELSRMGVAARCLAVAEACGRPDVATAFAAARAAHGPYAGPMGYEELRQTLMGALKGCGVDTGGVTVRMTWDGKSELGVQVVADQAAVAQAEAALGADR
jgi:hypothetical protein